MVEKNVIEQDEGAFCQGQIEQETIFKVEFVHSRSLSDSLDSDYIHHQEYQTNDPAYVFYEAHLGIFASVYLFKNRLRLL